MSKRLKSSLLLAIVSSAAFIHSIPIETRALAGVITTCKVPKTFALTFDDGPYYNQNKISDYLSAHGSHGTFFINGNNWDCIYDEKVVQQLRHTFEQGHLIGSHTWSHLHSPELTDAEFNQQLELMETAMKKILGVVPRYFRAPYGELSEPNLAIIKKRGYKAIDWSLDAGDGIGFSITDSKKVYDQASETFPTPQIALNHETSATTVSDLTPYAVSKLKNVGYRLVTVAECLGLGNNSSAYYQYVGKPSKRDASWTCAGKPTPGND